MLGRCEAARQVHKAVVKMLSEGRAKPDLALLKRFLDMAVAMNHLLQHVLMEQIGQTILRVLEYLKEKRLPCTLSGSEALRLQLPATLYNSILNEALIQDAADSEGLGGVLTTAQDKIPRNKKATVVAYLFDQGHHPIMPLTAPTLLLMLQNAVVDIYIIILHRKMQYEEQPLLVQNFMDAFKGAGRWFEFDDSPKGVKEATDFVLSLQATVFLDLVGNQNGRILGFPARNFAQVVAHYVNVAAYLGNKQHTHGIFDQYMSDKKPAIAHGEEEKIVACWQPALPKVYLDQVVRKERSRPGLLRLFVPLILDRAAELLQWIWKILQLLPSTCVYFQGFPVCNIKEILESASQFEEANDMPKGAIRGRVYFLRRMPLDEFIPFLRRLKLDAAINGGNYPAHTGQQAAMAAGIPCVAVESDTVTGQVPQSLNNMAGLGALNAKSWSDGVDMIQFLHQNPEMLGKAQGQLDRIAINGESLFDQERTARELQNMAVSVHSGRGESGGSCAPPPPFLKVTRGVGGKLVEIAVEQNAGNGQGESGMASMSASAVFSATGGARYGFWEPLFPSDDIGGRMRVCPSSTNGRRKHAREDAGDGGHSGPAPPPPSASGSGQCPCIPPCPLRTQAPVAAFNGSVVDGALDVPPRGLTLRELLSLMVVISQHHMLWLQLGPSALGFSVSELLKDGQVTALCEWAYGYPPGTLGPEGTRGYSFRNRLLDTPSRNATAAVRVLLENAREHLSYMQPKNDRGSVDGVLKGLLRATFQGAGHSPDDPDNDGWVVLFSSPALTEALGYFAIQRGVTVGQSVAEVASAVEGVVYDGQRRVAGNCYQPRLHAYKVLVADAGGLGGGGGAGGPNSCGCGGGEPAI